MIVYKPFIWFGGKGRIARWVADHIPSGKIYVEPFCGSAAVYWRIYSRFKIRVLNDMDARIVNLFRVLQDRQKCAELEHRVRFTPYARDEFRRALEIMKNGSMDDVEYAWAFFVAQNQGFAGKADGEGNWGRSFTSSGGGSSEVRRYNAKKDCFHVWLDALQECCIDNIDGVECIRYWDSDETVFYIDPPYDSETRQSKNDYLCEITRDDHVKLVEVLLNVRGRVVLSGYDTPIYRPLEEAGWRRVARRTVCYAVGKTRASGLRGVSARETHPREEILWLNFPEPEQPNAVAVGDLFSGLDEPASEES